MKDNGTPLARIDLQSTKGQIDDPNTEIMCTELTVAYEGADTYGAVFRGFNRFAHGIGQSVFEVTNNLGRRVAVQAELHEIED